MDISSTGGRMKVTVSNINNMLKMIRDNIPIREIEKKENCKILHKILPVMKRMYNENLPLKIGKTELQIIIGKLREEELNYRKRIKMRKYQKHIIDFMR